MWWGWSRNFSAVRRKLLTGTYVLTLSPNVVRVKSWPVRRKLLTGTKRRYNFCGGEGEVEVLHRQEETPDGHICFNSISKCGEGEVEDLHRQEETPDGHICFNSISKCGEGEVLHRQEETPDGHKKRKLLTGTYVLTLSPNVVKVKSWPVRRKLLTGTEKR